MWWDKSHGTVVRGQGIGKAKQRALDMCFPCVSIPGGKLFVMASYENHWELRRRKQ